MSDYRLYCYDGAGNVWAADWIKAASDESAIQAARSLNIGVKCEVWKGDKCVAAIERTQATQRDGQSMSEIGRKQDWHVINPAAR